MKVFIIILFVFLISLLSTDIKVDIRKIEVINKKIRFKIFIKLYIFKYIKIFQKKLSKRNLLKLIKSPKKIKENKNIVKKLAIQIEKVNLRIYYKIKNPITNAYLYSFLQGFVNLNLQLLNIEERNITIKNNYNKKFYFYLESKITINIAKTIWTGFIKNIPQKIMSKKVVKNI